MDVSTRKRRRYTVEEKLEIVKVARSSSFTAAHRRFGTSRASIHEWSKLEMELSQLHPSATQFARTAALPVPQVTLANAPSTFACNQNNGDPLECVTTSTNLIGSPFSPATPTVTEQAPNVVGSENNETSSANAVVSEQTPINTQGTMAPALEMFCIDSSAEGASLNEQPLRTILIGIHGERSGFADIAARRTFAHLCTLNASSTSTFEVTGYPQVYHMLNALHTREIDYAFVDTETLLSPTDRITLDKVASLHCVFVGKVASQENARVCALPSMLLLDADCVMSDWRLLSRHEEYIQNLEAFHNHDIHRQVCWDSATACCIVQEEQAEDTLVLCSEEAALANGLVVIASTSTRSNYMIIGRRGTPALAFQDIVGLRNVGPSTRQSTMLLYCDGRVHLLDVIAAFANVHLTIEHFSIRDHGDERIRSSQSCLISDRSSTNAVVEATLDRNLTAIADRVIHLGNYFTHSIRDVD